jgi:sec-independent protein translocase protein TatA
MGTILMIGGQEIILVILVALVLFGADKIPDLARTVGKGMREFKKASDDIMREINSSTSDIRKDLNDITDSVKKDLDKVTGTIMNEANAAQTSVQQKIDEVSTGVNQAANSVAQSWNNDPQPNFNDSTEQWVYGKDGYTEAPYDHREVEQAHVSEVADPKVVTNNIQPDPDNANTAAQVPPYNAGYDPYTDPESPYFDPTRV